MERTELIARALGPFLVIMGTVVAVRWRHWVPVIARYADDGLVRLTWATVELLAGLFLVVAHNTWQSPAAVVISLIGWLAVLEGTLLLLLPERIVRRVLHTVNTRAMYLVGGALSLLAGVYLCVVAFG